MLTQSLKHTLFEASSAAHGQPVRGSHWLRNWLRGPAGKWVARATSPEHWQTGCAQANPFGAPAATGAVSGALGLNRLGMDRDEICRWAETPLALRQRLEGTPSAGPLPPPIPSGPPLGGTVPRRRPATLSGPLPPPGGSERRRLRLATRSGPRPPLGDLAGTGLLRPQVALAHQLLLRATGPLPRRGTQAPPPSSAGQRLRHPSPHARGPTRGTRLCRSRPRGSRWTRSHALRGQGRAPSWQLADGTLA